MIHSYPIISEVPLLQADTLYQQDGPWSYTRVTAARESWLHYEENIILKLQVERGPATRPNLEPSSYRKDSIFVTQQRGIGQRTSFNLGKWSQQIRNWDETMPV